MGIGRGRWRVLIDAYGRPGVVSPGVTVDAWLEVLAV
jgi:hypothetical protein